MYHIRCNPFFHTITVVCMTVLICSCNKLFVGAQPSNLERSTGLNEMQQNRQTDEQARTTNEEPSLGNHPTKLPSKVGEDGYGTLREFDEMETPNTEFYCRVCGAKLAQASWYIPDLPEYLNKDRLSYMQREPRLGEHGLVSAFRNKHGAEHRLALFTHGENLETKDLSSDADTYFVGYNWQAATCAECHTHVGWIFSKPGSASETTVKSDNKQAQNRRKHRHNLHDSTLDGVRKAQNENPTTVRVIQPADDTHAEDILSNLKGTCQIFPMGWWTVRVCHGQEIRQFHREPDGSTSPDWSLGKFNPDRRIERTSFYGVPKGYFYSHFYSHGQICHENNKHRSTEVQFLCCPTRWNDKHPTILGVTEPSLCKYILRVCVPEVCEVDKQQKKVADSNEKQDSTVDTETKRGHNEGTTTTTDIDQETVINKAADKQLEESQNTESASIHDSKLDSTTKQSHITTSSQTDSIQEQTTQTDSVQEQTTQTDSVQEQKTQTDSVQEQTTQTDSKTQQKKDLSYKEDETHSNHRKSLFAALWPTMVGDQDEQVLWMNELSYTNAMHIQ